MHYTCIFHFCYFHQLFHATTEHSQNEDCKGSSFDSIVFAFEDLNFVYFEFQVLQLV